MYKFYSLLFLLFFQIEMQASCTGLTTWTASNGTINDGSGTGNYSDNQKCKWLISVPGATGIRVVFTSFNVHPSDTIKFYEGVDTSGLFLAAIPGSTLPFWGDEIVGMSGNLYIEFVTDDSLTGSGWEFNYDRISTPFQQTQILTGYTGSFVFSGVAYIRIDPPDNVYSITIDFTTWALDSNDYISFYDGLTTQNQISNAYGYDSETTVEAHISSANSGNLFIVVHGFNPGSVAVNYTTNLFTTFCSSSQNNNCQGAIYDGSWGGDYGKYSNCTWDINTAPSSATTISFLPVDLGIGDTIKIKTGNTLNGIIAGPISEHTTPIIVQAGSTCKLTFTSDGIDEADGWTANYCCTPYLNAITGPASFCPNQIWLVYSAPSIPGVTFNWILPAGWDTVVMTSNSITVDPSGSGTIMLSGTTSCGTSSNIASLYITDVGTSVPSPGLIVGPDTVCAGDTLQFSVAPVNGLTYHWLYPSGWTLLPGTNNVIRLVAGTIPGNLSVWAINSCGYTGPTSTKLVNIHSLLGVISSISGDTLICDGALHTYALSPVLNAQSYSWNLPPGWSGNSNTTAIDVASMYGDGFVEVTAQGICESNSFILPVKNRRLVNPVLSSTDSTTCTGDSILLIAQPFLAGSEYLWDLPPSFTGSSDSSSIEIVTGNSNDYVAVKITNECGFSPSDSLFIKVDQHPPVIYSINGLAIPCSGSVQSYTTVSDSTALFFNWTAPAGWFNSGSNSNSCIMITGSASGTISVSGQNGCGPGLPLLYAVTPLSVPVTATVTGPSLPASGTTQIYIANSLNANQYNWTVPADWQINSGIGTSVLNVTVGNDSGFVCVLPINSCGPGSQQCVGVVTALNDLFSNLNFSYYYDQLNSHLNLMFNTSQNEKLKCVISTVTGQEISVEDFHGLNQPFTHIINTSHLQAGIYQVTIFSNKASRTLRFMKI